MNNDGIDLLQQRQYGEAINSFGMSLRTLNNLLSSHTLSGEPQSVRCGSDDDHIKENDESRSADAEMRSSRCDEKEHSSAATDSIEIVNGSSAVPVSSKALQDFRTPTMADHLEELQGHAALIYKKPISMFRFSRMAVFSYNKVVEMSISVMFNFALAHHLYAVSGQCQDPERVMSQAVALYELTHSLQLQEGIELSLEYTMGTICNLGHIHQFRGDLEKSSKCFQHLLSIFCFLQSQTSLEVGQPRSFNGRMDAAGDDDQHGDRVSGSTSTSCLRKLLDSDVLFGSVSHLLLSDAAAAAA